MTVLGVILIVLGCIAAIADQVRFMVITFRHGPGWFFACLFLPIVGWVFFLMYFKDAWRPVVLSTAGLVIAWIGYLIGGFEF